jgi:hypothetical protein
VLRHLLLRDGDVGDDVWCHLHRCSHLNHLILLMNQLNLLTHLNLLCHLAYGDRGHHDGDGDYEMNGSLNQMMENRLNLNRCSLKMELPSRPPLSQALQMLYAPSLEPSLESVLGIVELEQLPSCAT